MPRTRRTSRFESEIAYIAAKEGRSIRQTRELIEGLGIKLYRTKKSLTCGYAECTRADCCGTGLRHQSGKLDRRGIRLVSESTDHPKEEG